MSVHGDDPAAYSDAMLAQRSQAILAGDYPPLVVLRHGPGHHIVGDAHLLRAARALGLKRVRCFVGEPRAGAPGHQTSDVAY
jgi:ParB-like chromosome segregation protein Spo0J